MGLLVSLPRLSVKFSAIVSLTVQFLPISHLLVNVLDLE